MHPSEAAPSRRLRMSIVFLTIAGLVGSVTGTMARTVSAAPRPSVDPVVITFTAAPTTAAPGTVFTTEPKVTVTGSTADVALSLVPVTVGAAGVLHCATTTVAQVAGVATFAGCTIDRGGQYTLRATVGTDTLDSATITVAGPEFAVQPNGGVAGVAWTGQPQVRIVDNDGAPITVDPTQKVGLVIKPGTGTLGATLTCTANPLDAVAGVATFAGCSIDRAGTGYQLLAAFQGGTVIGTSAAFNITAGAAAKLAFTTQPAGSPGGTNFAVQPVITVQDAYGNKVPGNTAQVTLQITSGTGTSGAVLGCTANPVTAVNGVATFAGCQIDKLGSGYTLTATATALTDAVSAALTIAAGTVTGISFTVSPGGGPGGTAFAIQPEVRLDDAGGNSVAGSATLSIKPGTGAPGAVLTCASNLAVGSGSPIAFTGCAIDLANPTGNPYVLVATNGALHADSQPFEVTIGTAYSADFLTWPTTGVGGEAFTTQPTVEVRDSGGNIAGGAVTLALADGLGRPGAVLACTGGNTANTVDGIATFSGCNIDQAGPDYRLVATVQGSPTATATSPAIEITVGAPHHLEFTTSPDGGTGGTAFALQPVVAVKDAGGNTIVDSIAVVALVVTDGSGLGSLSCTTDALQVIDGAAGFAGCSIDRIGTGYTLTATAGSLTGVSAPFDITVGAPVALEFSQQPRFATQGVAFGSQPHVTVTDAGGNAVASATPVGLSLTPGSGTAGATLTCAATSVAPTGGVAAFANCSLDRAGGGFAITATWGDLTAESLSFPVLIAAVPPLELVPTAAPVAQTFGGSAYAINPTATVNGVNSATGSLQHTVSDLTVVGVGADFVLDRTYNSRDTSLGAFGRGWTSVFDLSVVLSMNKLRATVRGEDGQKVVFTRPTTASAWLAPAGARADLTCTATTCTVKRWDGVTWTVAGTKLVSYLDATGQGLHFTYVNASKIVVKVATTNPAVTTDLVVTRANGRITKITTPTRKVTYGYTFGLLTSVTDVRGKTWTYGWTDYHLTSITDPDLQQRLVVRYDPLTGRVAAASAKGGPEHTDDTYQYDAANQRSIRLARTSVGGVVTNATYIDTYRSNVLIRQDFPAGITLRYSYDAQLHLIALQDPMGFVQEFTYSPAGDLISQKRPIDESTAAVVQYAYDSQHRIVSQTDAKGNTTTYGYTGANLTSVVEAAPKAGTTTFTYDALGQLLTVTTPIGRQTFGYDAAGNQTTMLETELPATPLNGLGTVATYDEAGNRTSFVDARGTTRGTPAMYTTKWKYDAAGNLLRTTDPLGTITSFTYDNAGDVATATTPDGTTTHVWSEGTLTRTMTGPAGTTTQRFDPSGNVLSEGTPVGGRTVHTYDAFGREVATTDPSGRVTRYTYDHSSNVVLVGLDGGTQMRRQFDALNQLIRSATDSEVRLTEFDLAGNPTEVSDNSGVTVRGFDSHSNVTFVTNSAGTTSYEYDLANNVVQRTDGRGGVTTYDHDGMSRVTQIAVDGKATKYTYDEAGALVQVEDPAGRLTTLTLDALDRPTRTTYAFKTGTPFTITVDQTFDWRNRRTSVSDATGSHAYSYDAKGNLVSAGTAGGTFTYDYSSPGATLETYPDGTTVEYQLDDAGALMQLVGHSADGDVTASYLRNLDRRTVGVAFSNGVLQTRSYDAAGNVAAQSVQHLGIVLAGDTYTYDANGNRLTQRTTGAGRSVSNAYAYDATGRILGFESSSVDVTEPVVDPAPPAPAPGNGLSLPAPGSFDLPTKQPDGTPTDTIAPASGDWAYDEVGNRTIDDASDYEYGDGDRISSQTDTTWTYDDSGAVTRINGPTGTSTFTYDAAARLIRAVVTKGANTTTVVYEYDGDGNRISRTINGVTTKFTWDPMNPIPMLVLERDSSNNVKRRYFHGEGTVAMQTPTHTYYFHNDPLGSTNQITDENGDVAAAYNYDALGVVTEAGPAAGAIDLLFQGQQLDRATGMYNMRARNYDPATGRFLQREPQATPVGVPVVSSYAFVGNRPTKLTDPTGLTAVTPSDFRPQVNEDADAAYDAKIAATALTVGIKGGAKIAELTGKGSIIAGKAAGEAAKAGGALSNSAKAVKAAGIGLAIIGIGLQTFITIETCKNGPVEKCVGSAVGLALNVAFTIGCSFITSGVGSAACAIGGAILGIALEYVIGEFGPEIADAFVAGYEATAAALSTAAEETLRGLNIAADAIVGVYNQAVGALTSGYNDAAAAITSGYEAALDALKDAGYKAEEIAYLLRDTFAAAARDTVAALINLGYDIKATAEALANSFLLTANEAAKFLKDAFNAAADEVAEALTDAYNLTAEGVAEALKFAEYAVSEVGAALENTFNIAADAVAGFLEDVGYEFEQIAAALTDGLNLIASELNAALAEVAHTAEQVAAAFRAFYDLTAEAAAELLEQAGYLAGQIADALKNAYFEAAAAVAAILQGIGFLAGEVADALKNAYAATAAAVTQFLKDAGYLISDIATALTNVFTSTAEEVTGFFKNVGYSVVEIGTALAAALSKTAEEAAQLLKNVGYFAAEVADALKNAFNIASDAATAAILSALNYSIEELMSALTSVYGTLAEGVASILKNLGYAAEQIAAALVSVYNLAADAIASLLKNIGYTIAEIGAILENVFNQVAAEAAAILQSIGATAVEIAGVLEDTFNQAVDAIGGLLTGLGFSSSVISDIGGAFEDFGNDVADFFGSLF